MTAWEITPDDVESVLLAHHIKVTPERLAEIHGDLDHDAIIDNLLYFTDFDNQVDSMYEDIEAELIEQKIIPGKPLFQMGDDVVDGEDFEDEDWEEEEDEYTFLDE